MTPIAKWFCLLLVATAHAFAFIYAWAFFGGSVGFRVIGATDSFLASLLASSFATAAISTAPLALLTGFVGGKRLITSTVFLFLAVWVSFQVYFHGPAVTQRPTAISLPVELATIAVVSVIFLLLGSRAASRRVVA